MATDPLSIIYNLKQVSTGYTVFEKNQVLTEIQLNDLANYLDDQDRLTRVALLGVGIVGGLRVQLAGDTVKISKGCGVTTDGDLLRLAADDIFDSIRPYDETAPIYPPFYSGSKMIKAFELLHKSEPGAQPMTTLPGKLSDMVVVMLMESYEKDPDLCTATDCGNLGKAALNTVRLLLVLRTDAALLQVTLDTDSAASPQLFEIFVDRPQIAGTITTNQALATLYRNASINANTAVTSWLGLLYPKFPALIGEMFNVDPSAAWIARLTEIKLIYAGMDTGIQYYLDFLKDLAETCNTLADVLIDSDSVLCPDVAAFPKHLLLGDLSNPMQSRTALYPSPLVNRGDKAREHARFLVWKLHTMINTFAPPADTDIIVTPSRDQAAALEERAIPFYYLYKDDFPIHRNWNHRLSMRGREGYNLGYRAAKFAGSIAISAPLGYQIGRYNFFRVEGHLGQDATIATTKIQQVIADKNLPFSVRAVLLHDDSKKIAVRPPIRYGDLHRFHHILRKDLSVQLDDARAFNAKFKTKIDDALASKKIPDQNISGTAETRFGEIVKGLADASPPLAQTTYSGYQQMRKAKDWRAPYKDVVNSAGGLKGTLGDVVRTDYTTVFDTIVSSNHPAWVDWLDTLIQAKDDNEDNKLLFSQFCKQNPGLEHCGGVSRGGTFVLIYDDKAKVVADFMLPYNWVDTAESEPENPVELPAPDFKLPGLIDSGYQFLPPIDWQFNVQLDAFEKTLEPKWTTQINMQKDYLKFFQDSIGTFTDIFSTKSGVNVNRGDVVTHFADSMLGFYVNQVNVQTNRVDDLRDILMNQKLPADTRERAGNLLKDAEADLAKSITNGTRYIVDAKIDVAPEADGGKALSHISQGMSKVANADARAQLGAGLKDIQINANTDANLNAIGSLMSVGGFKF